MRAQRVREGESRAEMQIAKWTAEGAVKGGGRVFCDVGHTSVAGNMMVFRKAHGSFRESRWHRGWILRSSLTEDYSVRGGRFYISGIMTAYGSLHLANKVCLHALFYHKK